ncbi:methyl-accepting chemotaxis protein [Vibrio profundi]|uniref:methyl-accepting chemotaxis protein n=1 Tax=Vibrio profundi TaxID=1774960 RepID=UPI003735904C
MTLKYKMLITLLVIGLFPAIIISSWALYVANKNFEKQTFSQLVALREVKKAAVIDYLETRVEQANSLSRNQTIISAVQGLSNAFHSAAQRNNQTDFSPARLQDTLTRYYQSNFIPKLDSNSPQLQGTISANSLVEPISYSGQLVQNAYIVENPNPIGSKEKLDNSTQLAGYDWEHSAIHPYLRDLLERFGYYDIFLLDINTGEIIYSVFKEVDFGTSMLNGPYADSGLGEAFRAARSASYGEDAKLVDFASYVPSYNAPAGFIATPIFEGGQKVGVLALQFPIDRLNLIMAERSGLGETGETYLVGPEMLMRSDSYLDPEFRSVNASFQNPQTGTVETASVHNALSGNSGVDEITDYNGNLVLSAYEPLKAFGLNWAIITEIDEKEALSAFYQLREVLLLLVGAAVIVIIGVSFYFSRSILKPLGGEPRVMENIASNIAQGNLSMTFETNAKDGGVYLSMQKMAHSLKHMLSRINDAATQQSNASQHLLSVTTDTDRSVNQQRESTEQVATAMNELATTVNEVTQNANHAAQAASHANDKVNFSVKHVQDVSTEIKNLSKGLSDSGAKIDHLNTSADNISNILVTIESISDKTNLLALNAAIEAARAGEQGRGFAVVADEVRALATSTKDSTEEITKMIDALQKDAKACQVVMEKGIEQASFVAKHAEDSTESLNEAASSVETIADITVQIATVAEEQAAVTEEINRNIQEISLMSVEAEKSVQKITHSSSQLDELSCSLEELVGEFKVQV